MQVNKRARMMIDVEAEVELLKTTIDMLPSKRAEDSSTDTSWPRPWTASTIRRVATIPNDPVVLLPVTLPCVSHAFDVCSLSTSGKPTRPAANSARPLGQRQPWAGTAVKIDGSRESVDWLRFF